MDTPHILYIVLLLFIALLHIAIFQQGHKSVTISEQRGGECSYPLGAVWNCFFQSETYPRDGLFVVITTTYFNGLCYGGFARFLLSNRAAGVPLVNAFDIEQRRAANSFTAL